jgi:hypothetical protein
MSLFDWAKEQLGINKPLFSDIPKQDPNSNTPQQPKIVEVNLNDTPSPLFKKEDSDVEKKSWDYS